MKRVIRQAAGHAARQAGPYAGSRAAHVGDAAFEYFQAILLAGTYLAKLTSSLGISDSLTGILSSIIALGGTFRIASVYLFPKQPVKKKVMVFEALNQLLAISLYLLPLWGLPSGVGIALFAALLISHHVMLNVCFPAKVGWMMGLVDDNRRGRFTAVKEMISLISGVAFTYAMGGVIDRYEAMGAPEGAFRICVWVLIALFVIRMVLLTVCREKPAAAKGKAEGGGMRAVLSQPVMRRLIGLNVLIFIAQYVTTPFLGTYQVNELGFSMTFVAGLSFVYSAVRIAASFFLGAYADKKGFAAMMQICFLLMAMAFGVNMFTAPGNGKVMFTLYYSLYAMAMGGLNSGATNLVFDYSPPEQRSAALAVYSSVGGLAGFLTTLAVSPLVAKIQAAGNQIFGMTVYAQQLMSGVSFVMMFVLMLYMQKGILSMPRPEHAGK